MNRYIKIFILLAIPALLLASGENDMAQKYLKLTGRSTDFIPRLFNFILLIALLYYLLAEPLKKFLKGRSESIANRLKEIEDKRQASKEKRERALAELEEAKIKAKGILKDAEAEIALIKENIKKKTEQELANLEKIFKEKCSIKKRKVIRETTFNVLDENIKNDDIPLDTEKIINIITKEVA